MKKIFLFFLVVFSLNQTTNSQYIKLSVYAEVSIITAGPGNELFEAFGHSAIRIKDPVLQLDLVYNYGMFDFNAPNFYLNFVKGDLIYKLGRYPFKNFENSYKIDKRWIKEQILDLTQQQKQYYFETLETNVIPQNASYFYDPYFNNCATKLVDISNQILKEKIKLSDSFISEDKSLRTLMLAEIPWNTWGAFGINLALGSKLDETATANGYFYLPDYLYLGFKNGKITKDGEITSLVKKENIILDYPEKTQKILLWNPLLIFSIVLVLGILITVANIKRKTNTNLFDFLLFFITGILGVIILYLWFFTNHATAINNFNFLWCFAPNLFIAFYLRKKKKPNWLKSYLNIYLVLLFLIPILWFFEIQHFPKSAIPFIILLVIRSLSLRNILLSSKE